MEIISIEKETILELEAEVNIKLADGYFRDGLVFVTCCGMADGRMMKMYYQIMIK